MEAVNRPTFASPATQNSINETSDNQDRKPEEPTSETVVTDPPETVTKPTIGISDEQYEDLFACVLSRAASGKLTVPQKPTKVYCNPSAAAEDFVDRLQNATPVNVQDQNEITPNTSPLEEDLLKKNLLKPIKEKPRKSINNVHKKTSLEYSNHINKDTSRKEKKRKHHKKSVENHETTNKRKYLTKGVWVQCCAKSCLKWRFLENCVDPSILPEYWTCALSTDTEQNKCSLPEVDWSCLSNSQDHFVYTEYNAGSIVWARLPGYPAWPAMVDSDPDTSLFYEYDQEGTVLRYHVVFLDQNVSRAWVPQKFVASYTKNPFKAAAQLGGDFRLELKAAVSEAEKAAQMTVEERLQRYNFETRFAQERSNSKCWTPKRYRKHSKSAKSSPRQQKQEQPTDLASQQHKKHKDQVVPTIRLHHNDDSDKRDEPANEKYEYWEQASDNLDDSFVSSKSEADEDFSIDESAQVSEVSTKVVAVPKKAKSLAQETSKGKGEVLGKSKKTTPKKDEAPSKSKPDVQKVNSSSKVAKKPSFMAPARKPTFKQPKKSTKSTSGAVGEPAAPTNNGEAPVPKPLNLDSEIFTMEMDSRPIGAEEDTADSKSADVNDKENKTEEKTVEDDEPIDLSLKSQPDEVTSPCLSNKGSVSPPKDFWADAQEKVTVEEIEDPFLSDGLGLDANMEEDGTEAMEKWKDCKLEQLDEWMPVISDQ